MAQKTRTELKGYFETGDVPTQAQFADLIDSQANIPDDGTPLTDASAFATAAQGVLADTAVQNADFNIAHSILVQQSGTGTPTPLSVPSSSIVGNNGGGDIVALTPTQVRTMINVENGADVTDATNVEAAGALMDSEVTNLAQVKAFDSTDYATAAQGAKADTATQPADLAPYLTSATAASTYEPLKGADDNYVTDAEKVVIGNTSGTNTGDETTGSIQTKRPLKTINSTSLEGAGNIVISAGSVEGTAVLSTGETGGTKFLREDGDGTSSWQAIPGGGDALTSSPLSQFAATTSLQLKGVISDETGSGALVFATSPTLVTPALGTPSSATLTNATGLPIVAGTTGTLSVARGGTGAATLTGIVKGNGTGAFTAVTAPSGAIVGTTETQTLTNKTLTSPVINTPTGIVKGDVGLGNVDNTSDATKNSATATLTNKRITMRVQAVTSAATVTPSWDNDDCVQITAQAAALTLANPSGTPTSMQPITIRIKDDGTARAISYGTQYRGIGVTLPATTVISKTLYLGGMWNAADSKFDIIGYALEA